METNSVLETQEQTKLESTVYKKKKVMDPSNKKYSTLWNIYKIKRKIDLYNKRIIENQITIDFGINIGILETIYKDHIRYTFYQFSLCKETHKHLASGLKSAQFQENKNWLVYSSLHE